MKGGVSQARTTAGREFDLPVRAFSGAVAHRAVHTGPMRLEEHAHDWPCLALHLLGRYRECNSGGETRLAGPTAVLHAPGEAHREAFEEAGAEVLILQFDPSWLRAAGWEGALDRCRTWAWGEAAGAARDLARNWMDSRLTERSLAHATARFLRLAYALGPPKARPAWLEEALHGETTGVRSASDLARACSRHRAWVARAYRSAAGEGLRETVRRRCVERAMALLRANAAPLAEVALDAGFCDQSHMIRAFRRQLGRTPGQVRAAKLGLAPARA